MSPNNNNTADQHERKRGKNDGRMNPAYFDDENNGDDLFQASTMGGHGGGNVISNDVNTVNSQFHKSRSVATLFGLVELPFLDNVMLRPSILLLVLCFASIVSGGSINGLVPAVISSLELRFGLNSKESGFIASAYDVGSLIFIFPIAYYGGKNKASKSRYLAIGCFILAVANFLMSLPHYLTDLYVPGGTSDSAFGEESVSSTSSVSTSPLDTCDVNRVDDSQCDDHNTTTNENTSDFDKTSLRHYYPIFVFAQMLCGVGLAPLITIAIVYLDDNCSKKLAPLFIGIYQATLMAGPALGFIGAGYMLRLYVDFETIDNPSVTPRSPLWLGAWWLGFLIVAVAMSISGIFISFFPSLLPNAHKYDHVKNNTNDMSTNRPIEMIYAMKNLFSNPLYVALSLAVAMEMFNISGLGAFLPKYISTQYNVSPGLGSVYVGLMTVVFSTLGVLTGSFVCSCLKLSRTQIILFCFITQSLIVPLSLNFLLNRCSSMPFHGLIDKFGNVNASFSGDEFLSSNPFDNEPFGCSAMPNCSCASLDYDPVCGSDNVIYFNPCYAGCTGVATTPNQMKSLNYTECHCVGSSQTTDDQSNDVIGKSARKTRCKDSCDNTLLIFMGLLGTKAFIMALVMLPHTIAVLESVEYHERSIAIAFQTIFVRIFGTIISPVAYGAVMDSACILWKTGSVSSCNGDSESESSNCNVYDNYQLSIGFFLVFGGIKFLNVLFYAAALFFSRRSDKVNQNIVVKEVDEY